MDQTTIPARGTVAGPYAESSLDISFFVPCYNEEAHIEGTLAKLATAMAEVGRTYEVLVFDDGSKDDTIGAVKRYCAEHPDMPVRLFVNERNRGLATNFFEGAFQARGEYYKLVCGDDVDSLESHIAILRRMGEADIIVPYYVEIKDRPMHRHVISRLFTWLVNAASKNKLNYYNGCPVYRRYDVMRYHVEAAGFGYQAEFMTRLFNEGRTYLEVGVVNQDRPGSSALTFRNFCSVGHTLFKIFLRRLRVNLFKW